MSDESAATVWLEELFADERTQLTWAQVRDHRKEARFPRKVVHDAIRELEFQGILECDRTADDSNQWVWRHKPIQSREQGAGPTTQHDGAATVILDRDELMDLLDGARRLTHPDLTKGPVAKANDVTARLNAMIDRLRN